MIQYVYQSKMITFAKGSVHSYFDPNFCKKEKTQNLARSTYRCNLQIKFCPKFIKGKGIVEFRLEGTYNFNVQINFSPKFIKTKNSRISIKNTYTFNV